MKQVCEVAIIGAGPYGLSLAAHLNARGVDFRIFGKPLDTWTTHMPKNMTLKSEGFASNLSAPSPNSTLKAYYAKRGLPYSDQGLPIPLDNFLAYADSFRHRFVPGLENLQVTSLDRDAGGFQLTLETGERVTARNVVLAVGVTWFAYTPPVLAALPTGAITHSFNHRTVDQFKNREVVVVGSGSSAIDLAHLLQNSGASARIVARTPAIQYNSVPDPDMEKLIYRLQNPASKIGRGWRSYFCAEAPLLFHRLPKHLKTRAITSHMHPAAGWFMRDEVEGRIPMTLDRSLEKAEEKRGRVTLTLADPSGKEERLTCDHVIAATGYRVDLQRVPFLASGLSDAMALTESSPAVSDNFETSVRGLYAMGLSAMESFGPLLRFMVGAEFAAPRLAAHLERKTMQASTRHAA